MVTATFGILRIGHRLEHVSKARAWIGCRIAKTITYPMVIAGEAVDNIILCAGETIANAVVHSKGETTSDSDSTIEIRLSYSLSWVRVEVTDPGAGPGPLAARDVDPLSDEGGRGLWMVACLSDRWGQRLDEDGRTVWFEVAY